MRPLEGTRGLGLRQGSVDREPWDAEVVSDGFWSPNHTMVCLTLATRGCWGVVLSFLVCFELLPTTWHCLAPSALG